MVNKLLKIPWRIPIQLRISQNKNVASETEAAFLRYRPPGRIYNDEKKNRISLNILTCKFTIFTVLAESKNRDELVAKIKQKEESDEEDFHYGKDCFGLQNRIVCF